jgi:hypothetical protein
LRWSKSGSAAYGILRSWSTLILSAAAVKQSVRNGFLEVFLYGTIG